MVLVTPVFSWRLAETITAYGCMASPFEERGKAIAQPVQRWNPGL